MNIEILSKVFEKYGGWGLLLLILVFIILKGQFSFQYPRPIDKKKKE